MSAPADRTRWSAYLVRLGMVLIVACVAYLTRQAHHGLLTPQAEHSPGFDPDGQYHMRRVWRALRGEGQEAGNLVAMRDPWLAFPTDQAAGGAAIPWPAYYDALLTRTAIWSGVRAHAQNSAEEQKHAIEVHASRWSQSSSILAACALAYGGATYAGLACGFGAGLWYACAFGAVRYGAPGNGDHHAFIGLLAVLYLLAVGAGISGSVKAAPASRSLALARAASVVSACYLLLDAHWSAPELGVALLVVGWLACCTLRLRAAPLNSASSRTSGQGTWAGLLGGVLVGSWCAGLLYLGCAWLALQVACCLYPQSARVRVAHFAGHSFWLSSLLLLLLQRGNPWLTLQPWSLLVPSYAQSALAILAALSFWPWLGPGSAVRRGRAAAIALLTSGLALGLFWQSSTLRAWLTPAFQWLRAQGPFMANVTESQPLGTWNEIGRHLGWGVVLLPWLVVQASARCIRGSQRELLPWILAALFLLPLALLQRRFAELAAAPSGLLLGFCLSSLQARLPRRRRLWGAVVLLVGLLLSHPRVLRQSFEHWRQGSGADWDERAVHLGQRELARWLARSTPAVENPPSYAVLAQWDLGHLIEWVAERPSVACNFGDYVGRESFLAPARALLALDEREAEAVLSQYGCRYVLLTSRFRKQLHSLVTLLYPGQEQQWLGQGDGQALWLESVAARLLQTGGGLPDAPELSALTSLRLVHLAPDHVRDARAPGSSIALPVGWIFEHVRGAELSIAGTAGEQLALLLRLRYPGVARELQWRAAATLDAGGQARLRVPYCTDRANGDGEVDGLAQWSCGARIGEIAIPEEAVQSGALLELP